jgi:YYY domain-containing protein
MLLDRLGEGSLASFRSTIPGLPFVARAVVGMFEILLGQKPLAIRPNDWYWAASRAIPSGPHEAVITEFPFFTFLYADLHAHLLALPLALLSLSVGVAIVLKAAQEPTSDLAWWRQRLPDVGILLLWSLAIGAMRTTNTWDVPPHLIIVAGALCIAEFTRCRRQGRGLGLAVIHWAWQFGLVFLLSWTILYRPFWVSYGAFYNSIEVWTGTRTSLWSYLLVHGLFLFSLTSYLLARTLGSWPDLKPDPHVRRLRLALRYRDKPERLERATRIAGVRGVPVSSTVWALAGLLVLLLLFFLIPGIVPLTRANAEQTSLDAYTYRGLAVFALGLPLALLGLLLLFRPRVPTIERLWAFLFLLGLAMTLGVEIIVIQGDIGRMNTVFKFYLQTWVLWAVTAVAALSWLAPHRRQWRYGQRIWRGALAVLVFLAALYPPLAATAKVKDRFQQASGPGLDGRAYMETAHYYDAKGGEYDLKWDLGAIKWLQDNIVGSPVILEGHTPEYRWGARYSVYTGLPAVLGWNWHQRQQRAAASDQEVWERASDIALIYGSPLPAVAEELLRRYRVRYVIVGPLERIYYEQMGIEKFPQMVDAGILRLAYQSEEVKIYEVLP